MGFHNVRFPANLSFGSVGGPERRTEVVTLANGFEERNTPWAHSRRRYDAGVSMRSLDDIETLIAFFEARQGQLYAFRWKDWSDYKSCKASADPAFTDQIIGVGDGVQTVFPLKKTYRSGTEIYEREIVKPVSGTITIGIQGTQKTETIDYTVDVNTGLVSFTAPRSQQGTSSTCPCGSMPRSSRPRSPTSRRAMCHRFQSSRFGYDRVSSRFSSTFGYRDHHGLPVLVAGASGWCDVWIYGSRSQSDLRRDHLQCPQRVDGADRAAKFRPRGGQHRSARRAQRCVGL